MKSVVKVTLATLMLAVCGASYAAPSNCNYQTYISGNDLTNSNGQKLKSVAQILRQDRANYHNGYGDEYDNDDECGLDDAKARQRFENTLKKAKISPSVQRNILGGDVYVEVITSGNKVNVSIVQ